MTRDSAIDSGNTFRDGKRRKDNQAPVVSPDEAISGTFPHG
jgi:hypothetical protein